MTRGPVFVAMLQETGHLIPTFKLMRSLMQRGYDVRYLVAPSLRKVVEAEGFRAHPFFSEQVVAGQGNVLVRRRAITRRFREEIDRLREGPDTLLGVRPRLMMVDVTQPLLAMWARREGIPLVLLNTSLPQTHDFGIPPLRSSLSFDGSLRARLQSELAWQKFLLQRRAGAALADVLGMGPPYDVARRAARSFGVRSRELSSATMYMPQLTGVRELVFSPRELDFPRPESALRLHVESLDLARREAALPLQGLSADKPLVYCSLGSQLYRARDTPAFLRRMVEVFAEHTSRQLVIATGKHVAVAALGSLPRNVVAMERAPQLAVLARASLMITHGGLGSVKECIAHGVPMLVFPLDVDQPGNAARVEYHGMGLVGDVAGTRKEALSAMIERVLGEPSFRQRVQAMREHFERLERDRPGLRAIEQLLAK